MEQREQNKTIEQSHEILKVIRNTELGIQNEDISNLIKTLA